MIRVRRIRKDDVADLVALHAEHGPEWERRCMFPDWPEHVENRRRQVVSGFRAAATHRRLFCSLAHEDGRILGWLMYRLIDYPVFEHPIGQVMGEPIVVDPEQSDAVAARLLDHARKTMAKRGAEVLELLLPLNEREQRFPMEFWNGAGWRRSETVCYWQEEAERGEDPPEVRVASLLLLRLGYQGRKQVGLRKRKGVLILQFPDGTSQSLDEYLGAAPEYAEDRPGYDAAPDAVLDRLRRMADIPPGARGEGVTRLDCHIPPAWEALFRIESHSTGHVQIRLSEIRDL